MTREEARKTIDDILACFGNKPEDGTYVLTQLDAKDMREAIKVLEQQPCEDTISRQAVKDKYRENYASHLKDDKRGIDLSKYMEEPYKSFCKFIDSIPPVTPKPKMGHWLVKGQDAYCSTCNIESAYNPFGASEFSDYCPHCGAKMESEDTE